MTKLLVGMNLLLTKCGSYSELSSSCEIWRVAAVVLLGHLGRVSHIFNDEITRGVRGEINPFKGERTRD